MHISIKIIGQQSKHNQNTIPIRWKICFGFIKWPGFKPKFKCNSAIDKNVCGVSIESVALTAAFFNPRDLFETKRYSKHIFYLRLDYCLMLKWCVHYPVESLTVDIKVSASFFEFVLNVTMFACRNASNRCHANIHILIRMDGRLSVFLNKLRHKCARIDKVLSLWRVRERALNRVYLYIRFFCLQHAFQLLFDN